MIDTYSGFLSFAGCFTIPTKMKIMGHHFWPEAVLQQWGSYQIDVFSYRRDEHRQKITFRYRILEICICMNGRLENERALCVLMIVGFF